MRCAEKAGGACEKACTSQEASKKIKQKLVF